MQEKGVCGQSQSTTGKPKCPSAPRLALHRLWVTRYRCIWQKTRGEVTPKCRFLTLPEYREEKVLHAEGHLPFPEGESVWQEMVRGSNLLATAFFSKGNLKNVYSSTILRYILRRLNFANELGGFYPLRITPQLQERTALQTKPTQQNPAPSPCQPGCSAAAGCSGSSRRPSGPSRLGCAPDRLLAEERRLRVLGITAIWHLRGLQQWWWDNIFISTRGVSGQSSTTDPPCKKTY